MQVTVTGEGKLQLNDGGQVSPPLTVEAVQMLANSIPAAQAVLVKVPLSDALARIGDGLSSGAASATVTVSGSTVNITADPPTFADLAQALGVTPGVSTTSFTTGNVTVTKTGATT